MTDDPYQKFLHWLFDYRIVLAIIILVAFVNVLATFLNSIQAIKSFLKAITVFLDELFYTEKKFKRDAIKLADEIKIFLQKKDLEIPIINMATSEDFAENLIENEKLIQRVRLQFFTDFRDRLLHLQAKARKYNFHISSIEKAIDDPSNLNGAKIMIELNEISGNSSKIK